MDEIDAKIIDILRKNGRIPLTKIAEKVGLTEGAIRYRMNELIKSGAIKRFTIELGGEIRAIVLIITETQIPTENISKAIEIFPEARDVYEVSGDYSIICLVVGETVDEVNRAIEKIRLVKGVAKTVTCLVLRQLRKS